MHEMATREARVYAKGLSQALQRALWTEGTLFDALPIGVYVCDADGVVVQFNAMAAELWGRSPVPFDTDERFCGSFRLYRTDGSLLPHAQTPMAEALRTGKPQRDFEVWIERPDGTRVAALVNIEPMFEDDGKLLGAVNCFQDITARKHAEQRLQDNEQKLNATLQAVPGAIYTTDAQGRITFYNQAAAKLWGVEPELGQSEWCGSWRLRWPDGRLMPHDDCPMAVALKEKRAIRGEEAIAERPDGKHVPFLAFPTPLIDEAGQLTGAINMLVDVSELWQAREALRTSEEFNRKVLESSRDCIKVLDLDGRLLSINACGLKYLEVDDPSQIEGASYVGLWKGADRPAAQVAVRRARKGEVGRFTGHYRAASGRESWWDEVVSPIVSTFGVPERLLVISRDITERKQAEEQRKLLIDELNHRVKNMLATVLSIAGQTFRHSSAPADLVQAFEARVMALSRAHDHLSNSGWREADFRSVLRDILVPYRGNERERIRLRGSPARLSPRATVTLAMILHELATNAAKYGALSSYGGRLSVAWRVADNGSQQKLLVSWREAGGPEVCPPKQAGFGSRMIERAVAHELNGTARLDYHPEGLRCRLEVPLPGAG